jgi:hypothetical protein
MKNFTSIFICLFLLAFLACDNEEDKIQNDLVKSSSKGSIENGWTALKCGLFINSKGDIGFPTEADLIFIPVSEIKGERSMCPNNFLTKLGYEDSLKLKTIIDTATFEFIGANYYLDANNVYLHYPVCDVGALIRFANDTATFKVVGSYAIYQDRVYHQSKGEIKADAVTFEVIEGGYEHIGRDKDGFFSFGERISKENLKSEIGDSQGIYY